MVPPHLSFLHCNACSLPFGLLANLKKDRYQPFYLTSCGHVFCNMCRADKTRPACAVCGAANPQLAELQSHMNDQIKRFFDNAVGSIEAEIAGESKAVQGVGVLKGTLQTVLANVGKVEEELKRSHEAKAALLKVLKFQTDQWQKLSAQNVELWKKQQTMKAEMKKKEKLIEEAAAKSKANQSKLKDKARAKILELQQKVDDLRTVLKKVTNRDPQYRDPASYQHLLETPVRPAGPGHSDSALWSTGSLEDSMNNSTIPQLTSTPRLPDGHHGDGRGGFPPGQGNLLSTPVSPNSKRHISPIVLTPGHGHQTASGYSTPRDRGGASSKATPQTYSKGGGRNGGVTQRTPLGPYNQGGYQRPNDGSTFPRSGSSAPKGRGNIENTTPNFMRSNLMSPYFTKRKKT